MWTTQRGKTPEDPVVGVERAPQYCEIYLLELDHVPTIHIRETSFQQELGKGTICTYTRAAVPNKCCTQGN